MHKFAGFVLCIVGLAGIAIAIRQVVRMPLSVAPTALEVTAQSVDLPSIVDILPRQEPYSAVFVGDIMLTRGVAGRVHRNGEDWSYPFQYITPLLQSADMAFGNHEGSVSDIGVDSGKEFSFRFDVASSAAVAAAGFDVVSLANNHALDWGYDALCDSANRLRAVGIVPIGGGCNASEAFAPYIRTFPDGTTIAMLGYTEFYKGATATEKRAGYTKYAIDSIAKDIADARAQGADIVVVSLHWGTEYQPHPNETQKTMGHAIIDAGADVIIGHHPHVVEDYEEYNGKHIFYSLGNFVFDQPFSEATMQGRMVRLCVLKHQIQIVQQFAVKINSDFQPLLEGGDLDLYTSGCPTM